MKAGRKAPTVALPETLAQRVQHLREQRGLSQTGLAEQASLPLDQIRDIESGLDTFLSATQRQKLARVLKIPPQLLKAVEKMPAPSAPPSLSQEGRERFLEEILHHPNQPYECPACSAPLVIRQFQRRDLEDHPLLEIKAHCSQCLFKL